MKKLIKRLKKGSVPDAKIKCLPQGLCHSNENAHLPPALLDVTNLSQSVEVTQHQLPYDLTNYCATFLKEGWKMFCYSQAQQQF